MSCDVDLDVDVDVDVDEDIDEDVDIDVDVDFEELEESFLQIAGTDTRSFSDQFIASMKTAW